MNASEILDWIWDDNWEVKLRAELIEELEDRQYIVEITSFLEDSITRSGKMDKNSYIDVIIGLAKEVRKQMREN